MWMIPSLESLQFALCDDDCYTAERTHATSSRAGVDRRITFFECRVLFAFIRMVTILTLMNGLKVARGVGYDHETPTVMVMIGLGNDDREVERGSNCPVSVSLR